KRSQFSLLGWLGSSPHCAPNDRPHSDAWQLHSVLSDGRDRVRGTRGRLAFGLCGASHQIWRAQWIEIGAARDRIDRAVIFEARALASVSLEHSFVIELSFVIDPKYSCRINREVVSCPSHLFNRSEAPGR